MPSWKKVIISGSNAALNSLTVSNGITGSLFGTASYATVAANGGVTQLLAGPNITLAPTNGLGQVTISSTSGGGGFNTATGSYGSFYDTTTQTNPVGNIPRSMSLDTTDITNGVSVSGSTNPFNTYIKTENAGVYDIQFSAQLDKTDSGTDEVVIWLRKNGIDLTDTATTITLNGNNDKQVAAWNWFVNSAANDYYQIIWLSADTDMRLLAEPISGTHPGIPSVIVTANRVDQFLSNTGSFSGSFTGQFTGSLQGTASFATQALSASFAVSSSRAVSSSFATLAASATSATSADTVKTSLVTTNATHYLTYVPDNNLSPTAESLGTVGNVTINPATGELGVPKIVATSITGSLQGTASVASTSVITTQDTTPITYNVTFTGGTSGNHSLNVDATTLTYNPSTTTLAVTNLAGNASTATSASQAATASFVTTLNQNVLITGSATIGAASAGASENTITLGARDGASEGGQIGFNAPGGTYTSASFIDNWQNKARLLKGNNTTSTGLIAQWDIHTTQMQLPGYTNASSFVGTATANLAVDSGGNVITVSTSGGSVFPYTGNAVITGSLTTTGIIYAQPNGGMYFQGGDDAALYDINISNHMGIYGVQNSTVGAIKLGSNGPVLYGSGSNLGINTTNPSSASLTVNGNIWATSLTGSLLGTASFAVSSSRAVSSSFATLAASATSADTATNATNVAVTDTTTGTGPYYLMFADGTSGNRATRVDSSTLQFNATTNTLTVPNLAGTASWATNASKVTVSTNAENVGFKVPFAATNVSTTGTYDLYQDSETTFTYNPSTNTLTVPNLTGTASFAVSSSRAVSSSFATQALSASFASTTLSSSFATQALSASFATTAATASFITGSNVFGPFGSNSVTSASFAVSSSRAVSSSFAQTASFVSSTSNAFIQNGNSFGTTALLGTNDNQPLALETNGSTRMFISSSGNIGIGTTTPATKLDIVSTTNDSFDSIIVRPTNLTQTLSIGWQGISASLNYIVNAGGSERMRITSTGNTGLNTSAPETKLQIEDVTKVLTNNVAGVAQGTLSLVSTDAQAANVGASLLFGGNYIDSNSTRIAYAAITGRKSNSTSVNADGYLSFLTWRTSGLTEAMRITAAGDVGVGTTTPLLTSAGRGNITINGSSQSVLTLATGGVWKGYLYSDGTNTDLSASGSLLFGISGGSEAMRINTSGQVGIGTTTPTSRLHTVTNASGPVSYDNRCAIFGYNTSTEVTFNNPVGIAGRVLTSGGRAVYGDATTGAGWAGYFDGKGYFSSSVGIGTTTPTLGTLQVNGNVFATSFTGSLQVTSSLSYNSSLSTSNVNGEIAYWGGGTVAAGTLYYYDSSGNWTAADADAESTSTGLLGIALAAGTASSVGILLRGHARFTGVSSFTAATTVGAKLYVSTTAGEFSQTAPTGTGDVVRIIGYVQSTANDQIYFCPDTTWVTLA